MNSKHIETQAIRTQMERSQFLEHSNPLYLTSSYVFEDAEDMRASFADEKERNIYSRYSNPNTSEFIEKICKMEFAERGYAFAAGMSAVFLDPLLSPGSAYLSDSNRMIGDMIKADMQGDDEAYRVMVPVFNRFSQFWLDNFFLHIKGLCGMITIDHNYIQERQVLAENDGMHMW